MEHLGKRTVLAPANTVKCEITTTNPRGAFSGSVFNALPNLPPEASARAEALRVQVRRHILRFMLENRISQADLARAIGPILGVKNASGTVTTLLKPTDAKHAMGLTTLAAIHAAYPDKFSLDKAVKEQIEHAVEIPDARGGKSPQPANGGPTVPLELFQTLVAQMKRLEKRLARIQARFAADSPPRRPAKTPAQGSGPHRKRGQG